MSYTDLLYQLQSDAAARGNSEPDFQYLPFAMYRQAVFATEIQKRLPHLAGKNGKVGVGALVMMPMITGEDPNIATPQGDVLFPVHIIEQPEINMASGGTGVTAEQWALLVRAFFHQWSDRGQIILMQDTQAIQPIPGLEEQYKGCVGYQVLFRGRLADQSYPQCATPSFSCDASGNVTLSTNDGSAIYYTTDGSFPGPGNTAGTHGACTAILYAAPFQVPSGTVVNYASFQAGLRGSDAMQSTVTYPSPILTYNGALNISWTFAGPAPAVWSLQYNHSGAWDGVVDLDGTINTYTMDTGDGRPRRVVGRDANGTICTPFSNTVSIP